MQLLARRAPATTTNCACSRPSARDGELRTLYRPADGGYVGEMDLHWDGDRLLFTQSDATNWKVFELRADGSGLRQVSRMPDDVDSFDACYLPNGKIMFGSTASFQSVPCWHGLKKVSNLYLMNADGTGVRQVCFDQDHDLHSTVLPNGQVLYNRWDYTGINHIYLRELMLMNPDGTGQRAVYGSSSWYPNALYFPRPLPGDAGKLVCILSGYHGPHRMGQLVILDTAKGWQEAEGIVQRISGRGDPIQPDGEGQPGRRRLAEVPPSVSAQRQILPRRRVAECQGELGHLPRRRVRQPRARARRTGLGACWSRCC